MPDATPPSQRLKLAVVGLGGIGGALAVALCAADRHDVVACARRPLAGLVLEWNDATLDLPLNVATDPRAVGPADWVMLSTKAHQTPDAAPWLASLCRPGSQAGNWGVANFFGVRLGRLTVRGFCGHPGAPFAA